jgi:hypothetical protein
MNQAIKFDLAFRRPVTDRLDEMRNLSNIIQALENAITQCDASPDYFEMQAAIEVHLVEARGRLRDLIHQLD